MKHYRHILMQRNEDVASITLNRADKKNALSFEMMDELIDAAKILKKQRDLRAVILQGAGQDFCSGLDLADLNNPKNMAFAAYQLMKPTPSKFQQVCLLWRSLPVPVMAVIDGVCVGGGLQLALGADIRIATLQARFSVLEAKWGLVADMGISQTAAGVRRDQLMELAMTARMMDAEAALASGLITHMTDDPHAKATALIEEIKTRSPDAVLAAKRVMYASRRVDYLALYQEKLWQMRLMLGANRKLAIKKVKDGSTQFIKRQFG